MSGWLRQIEEISSRIPSDVDAAVVNAVSEASDQAGRAARRASAEELNQAVRRMRASTNEAEIFAVLLDSTARFCTRAALFSVAGDQLSGEGFGGRELPLTEAPALASAAESGDPVVALPTASEISQPILDLFGESVGDKIHLFPIGSDGNTRALLCAAGVTEIAPLELLTQTAAFRLEAGESRKTPSATAGLISIQPAPAEPARTDWTTLGAEERALHLRAQQFARVQVAEIRLFQTPAVKLGRARNDLYSVLREQIDHAREGFRQKFLSASPSMVDYLHLELLGSLAQNDASMLGANYPGPMA